MLPHQADRPLVVAQGLQHEIIEIWRRQTEGGDNPAIFPELFQLEPIQIGGEIRKWLL
jgi:hypothetical protein